jgi:hypothetical protein
MHRQEIDMSESTGTPSKSVAAFLQKAIADSGKTHEQIAAELGYESAATNKMMAAGLTKVPIAKIRGLAAALGVDAKELGGLVIADAYPGLVELIADLFGMMALSASERRLIEAVREQGDGAEPVVVDAREVIAVVMM